MQVDHAQGYSGKPDIQSQMRLQSHLDPQLSSKQTSPRQEHGNLSSTTKYDLDLSSPSDRTTLTRYTNQTITSLAAYRDALIDENARLNAMLIDARAGLVVLSNSTEETEAENGAEHLKTRRMMMDVVKESMMDEIAQLREKAAQLSEEEKTLPSSGPVNGNLDASRYRLDASSTAIASAHEATSAIYYATINKLRDDLHASKKRRDDAKTTLVAVCRQSGPSNQVRAGSQRKMWRQTPGVNAINGQAASRNGSFEHATYQQVPDIDYTEEPTDPDMDESVLHLITDQEEIVWMREKKEREMERAFRDMKCYVESVIREWREVGSLPPPGKYQTISYPDINLPYIPTQIFPKRKGRPPRASVKVHQQVPESLQHLVAKSRTSQRARDFERYRKHVPAIPYTLADDAVLRRLSRRNKGKGGEMELTDLQQEDVEAKRRRIMLGDRASDYTNEASDAISAAVRHGSMSASNDESLRPGATSPNGPQTSISAEHLYDVSASAISDAMQAYTRQPLPDENVVFGESDMPGLDPADVAFDTQIPYQVQMVQRRALGYSGDSSVPGVLVNGGNVFDHPEDDVQLDGGDIVQQSPTSHDHNGQQYETSTSFRTFDQAAQDSVEGMIQQHIRDAQASVQDADSTLLQMQHVDNGNLEVSDTQQALESYRFDEALMDDDMNPQDDQPANSVLTTEVNADSADATAIAAQRLMNSLVPHATAEFDPSCQNCARRDTSVWRKLTVNGVDYKVCNACGLHYQKNGVMRPRALWGDVASEPRKRRSQRPFDSSAVPSAEQHQHDLMMDEALYEEPNEEDQLEHEPYGEGSYDVHYADGQYGIEGVEDNITAEDLPHYELNLGQ
ncbi:hypothetical protein QFC21_006024 [Naganishia friedmannii]|uniref:Uncharacterized protein n=1 Tax=Naganishia friedmannii TaxID=89922 RepID=A0ACC2V6E2_9TREE|nr:hypothetical protein QFC21_006024 [Naganishia friedmannii]